MLRLSNSSYFRKKILGNLVAHGYLLTKKVSAGSLAASVAIVIASLIFAVCTPKLILAVYSMCLAVFQHRENIKRLLHGNERKIGEKVSK